MRECLLTSPPLSPSPSKERGKRFIERGFTPPLPTLPLPLLREGGPGDGLLNNLLTIELQGKVDRYIVIYGVIPVAYIPLVCSFCRANDRMLDSSYGTQRPHD